MIHLGHLKKMGGIFYGLVHPHPFFANLLPIQTYGCFYGPPFHKSFDLCWKNIWLLELICPNPKIQCTIINKKWHCRVWYIHFLSKPRCLTTFLSFIAWVGAKVPKISLVALCLLVLPCAKCAYTPNLILSTIWWFLFIFAMSSMNFG